MSDHTLKLDQAEDLIKKAEQVQGGVVTRDQLKLSQRRNGRALKVTVALAIMVALLSLVGNVLIATRVAELRATDTIRDAAIKVLEKENEARKTQGLAPLPVPTDSSPPVSPEVDIQAIVNATSSIVLNQIRNDPMFRGATGTAGAPCDPTLNALCIGPEGAEGKQGQPGQDSPCVANIELCRGPTGDMGAKGDQGTPAPVPVATAFVGDSNACIFRTTYQRSDGTQYSLDAPTDSFNCP